MTLERSDVLAMSESPRVSGGNGATKGMRPAFGRPIGRVALSNSPIKSSIGFNFSWRFGGQRFCFICECGRRVEQLHAFRDWPWRCRHCYRLSYATRQAVPRHRHVIKVQKIREQLGGSLNLLDGTPPKPKGMHRKRYARLRWQHDAAVERVVGMTAARG